MHRAMKGCGPYVKHRQDGVQSSVWLLWCAAMDILSCERLSLVDVAIPTDGGSIPALIAVPEGDGPFATVLLAHEVYGTKGHIDDVARQLAASGYLAVAPLLSARHGNVHGLTDFQEIVALALSVPDSEVAADLTATLYWIRSLPACDPARVALCGFCWGGRHVWLHAHTDRKLACGVAWYGGPLSAARSELNPSHPTDVASTLQVPVLGIYGGSDHLINVSSVQKMQEELDLSVSGSQIIVLPNTPHGFHADGRPNFRERQAALAWRIMLKWLETNGCEPKLSHSRTDAALP